ncbi:APC family permease [Fructilactobacillus sanfranciscensis]|uniref:hypothetical protein n=1 Tax=Fructilactobacillus sanfranciscensis TaxID=1625 RepID=UPI00298C39AA|nr:hypothetical protein [Fructilactobacillus sanfranciscensis]
MAKKMVTLNKHDMPAFTMWAQALIVSFVIFAISFGGSGTQKFYLILTDMGNISSAVPYLFLIRAFPFFKRLQEIDRPFVFFKPGWKTNITVIIMMFIITLGIGFTAIQPIISKDFETAFWTIIGPLFFGLLGWLLYENGIRNIKLLEK